MKRRTPLLDLDDEKFAREDAARKVAGMSEQDRADILLKELDEAHQKQILADMEYRTYQMARVASVLCACALAFLVWNKW